MEYFQLKNSNKKYLDYLLKDNLEDNKTVFFHILKCENKPNFGLIFYDNNTEKIYEKKITRKTTYFNLEKKNSPFLMSIKPENKTSSIYFKYIYSDNETIKKFNPTLFSNLRVKYINESIILKFNQYLKNSTELINYIIFFINSTNSYVDLSNICSIKKNWIELNILTNFTIESNFDNLEINLTKYNFKGGSYKFNIIAKEINGLHTEFLYNEIKVFFGKSLFDNILEFFGFIFSFIGKLIIIIIVLSVVLIIAIIVLLIYSCKKNKKKVKEFNDFNTKFNPDNQFIPITSEEIQNKIN